MSRQKDEGTLERGRLRGVYRGREEEGVYRRVGVGPVLRVELRAGGKGQGLFHQLLRFSVENALHCERDEERV